MSYTHVCNVNRSHLATLTATEATPPCAACGLQNPNRGTLIPLHLAESITTMAQDRDTFPTMVAMMLPEFARYARSVIRDQAEAEAEAVRIADLANLMAGAWGALADTLTTRAMAADPAVVPDAL